MIAARVCPRRAACGARTLLLILLLALIALLALPSCGGGGEGAIAPFWLHGQLVVADLDGDGRDDVAVTTTCVAGSPPHPGYVEVYRQAATGVFAAPASYPVGADPWGLSSGDFDGDGAPDLLAASPATVAAQPGVVGDSGGVALLRQDPAQRGRLLPSQWIATGGIAQAAAIAELSGDGRADLAVGDGANANGRVLLLAQSAATPGTVQPPVTVPVGGGQGAADLAAGDLDGDGRADLVVAVTDGVVLLRQRAGGGFEPAQLLAAGLRPRGLALGDVDGDGRLDIVVANAGNAPAGGTGGASVTALRQTVPGAFIATGIALADGARHVAISDLNGDGVPDLAVISLVYQAQSVSSRVTLLLQSTVQRGTFAVGVVIDGPLNGDFIALGDANGDGRADLFINDGPAVALQRAAAPGTFEPFRALR